MDSRGTDYQELREPTSSLGRQTDMKTYVMRQIWPLSATAVCVGLIAAGCGLEQNAASDSTVDEPTPRSTPEATEEPPVQTTPDDAYGDCARDYPSYNSLEEALEAASLTVLGTAAREGSVRGEGVKTPTWQLSIEDPLGADDIEQSVLVLAPDGALHNEPCGPVLEEGQVGIYALSQSSSPSAARVSDDSYYPIAVFVHDAEGYTDIAGMAETVASLDDVRDIIEKDNRAHSP